MFLLFALQHLVLCVLNHKFQRSFGNGTLQRTAFVNSLVFHLLNCMFVEMLLDIVNSAKNIHTYIPTYVYIYIIIYYVISRNFSGSCPRW